MTGEDVAARVHAYAWTDRKPGLERTRALLAALGNPEKALKFVHITGSNGKTTTTRMVACLRSRGGGIPHGTVHLAAPLPLQRALSGERRAHPRCGA